MAQLTFTNDIERGSLSNAFSGGVNIHCVFNGGGRHVIFIESRIGDMPWSVLRTIVVKEQDVFSIPEAASSQMFRFFTDAEPTKAETSQISSCGSGGAPADPTQIIEPGTNGDGIVNTMQEVITAFGGFPEGQTIKDAIDTISGDGLQDEDIETIFYPKNVTGITADESGDRVVLEIIGQNIESDDALSWTIEIDGISKEIAATGNILELSADDSAAYKAAAMVTAKITVVSSDSDTFLLKGV